MGVRGHPTGRSSSDSRARAPRASPAPSRRFQSRSSRPAVKCQRAHFPERETEVRKIVSFSQRPPRERRVAVGA